MWIFGMISERCVLTKTLTTWKSKSATSVAERWTSRAIRTAPGTCLVCNSRWVWKKSARALARRLHSSVTHTWVRLRGWDAIRPCSRGGQPHRTLYILCRINIFDFNLCTACKQASIKAAAPRLGIHNTNKKQIVMSHCYTRFAFMCSSWIDFVKKTSHARSIFVYGLGHFLF